MSASKSIDAVARNARRSVDDARETVSDLRDAIPELARNAERALQERFGNLRGQSQETLDAAADRLEDARLYVIDRVQERPFTTTLAALGAGVLIGLLFASRRR